MGRWEQCTALVDVGNDFLGHPSQVVQVGLEVGQRWWGHRGYGHTEPGQRAAGVDDLLCALAELRVGIVGHRVSGADAERHRAVGEGERPVVESRL